MLTQLDIDTFVNSNPIEKYLTTTAEVISETAENAVIDLPEGDDKIISNNESKDKDVPLTTRRNKTNSLKTKKTTSQIPETNKDAFNAERTKRKDRYRKGLERCLRKMQFLKNDYENTKNNVDKISIRNNAVEEYNKLINLRNDTMEDKYFYESDLDYFNNLKKTEFDEITTWLEQLT
jgi:hypothetical protein